MYDAIVLAGGLARRLGGADKPALEVDGATLLARVVSAVSDASRIVVVGPQRPLDREVLWTREDPPGCGPVAAVAAALPLVSAEVVVVLAADMPWIAPAVPELLRALDGSAAVLVDPSGRANNLAAAWRRDALVAALASVGDPRGAAMRAVVAAAHPVLVPDAGGWGRDCDTWADVAAARSALGHSR